LAIHLPGELDFAIELQKAVIETTIGAKPATELGIVQGPFQELAHAHAGQVGKINKAQRWLVLGRGNDEQLATSAGNDRGGDGTTRGHQYAGKRQRAARRLLRAADALDELEQLLAPGGELLDSDTALKPL